MIRTVLALGSSSLDNTVTEALTKRGIQVRYRCDSGAEIIRAVKTMGGGVIICPFKLSDMTANDLGRTLVNEAYILVLAKGTELSLVTADNLFKFSVPIRLSELMGAVTMLLQMDIMRQNESIPKRSETAQNQIDEAKSLIMQHYNMTEPEAHRYLQKASMKNGARMSDTAFFVIQKLTGKL